MEKNRLPWLLLLGLFNLVSIFVYMGSSRSSVKEVELKQAIIGGDVKEVEAIKGEMMEEVELKQVIREMRAELEDLRADLRLALEIRDGNNQSNEKQKGSDNKSKSASIKPSKNEPVSKGKQEEKKLVAGKQQEQGRFLIFDWNGGRVNNNLMALAAALTVASRSVPPRVTILQRPKKRAIYNNARYAFIGLFEGFWDLEALTKAGHSWIFEDTPPAPEILRETVPPACKFNRTERFNYSSDCPVAYFQDAFPWMNDEEREIASKAVVADTVRTILRPAKWIQQIAESLFAEKFPSPPRISVHQRHQTHLDPTKQVEFTCRGKVTGIFSRKGVYYRHAAQVWDPNNVTRQDELLNITGLSCAMNFTDLQAILAYWKQAPLGPKEKFFLATDGEVEESVQSMLDHGAVTLETAAVDNRVSQFLPDILTQIASYNCSLDFCPSKNQLRALAAVLVDSWAMTLGKYFVGGYYSTMTSTACYWRGVSRMNDSNICFLPNRLRAQPQETKKVQTKSKKAGK